MKTLSLFLLLIWVNISPADEILENCLNHSVTVRAGDAFGSGVVFQRETGETFVWTNAHVAASATRQEIMLDPLTGMPKAYFRHNDLQVIKQTVENDRVVGEVSWYAKIVRYSNKTWGEDLALLRLYKVKPFTSSVVFHSGAAPKAGTGLWHVGSMAGPAGTDSVAEGVFGAVGKLRRQGHEPLDHPRIMDNVTIPALGGSSGGGVFLKENGQCIGLLTESLSGSSEAPNCIVPARRIREFAKKTKCEWALDHSIPVPEVDDQPISDQPVKLPKEWENKPPTSIPSPPAVFRIPPWPFPFRM